MENARSRKLTSFLAFAAGFLSLSISGCVNLDSPPPILASQRVVVNFTNQRLSALSEIPMGAYRIPQSQVIISGHQQGGVNFGSVNGIVTVSPEMITPSDVALAAFHLSRYVRSETEKAA